MTDGWAHDLPRTRGELPSRIHALALLHRPVPLPAAITLAMLRGELEWRLAPRRRAQVLRAALWTAPRGADPRATRRLARAHLREMCVQTELSWRPWDARRMPVDGIGHLNTACEAGGGVLLALLHLGPMYSLHHALAARGVRMSFPVAQQPGERRFAGADAHWVREQLGALERIGHELVPRGGAYARARDHLRAGGICGIAWDVPGDTRVELLGRPAGVRSGLVRLALETGAPILPAYAIRDRLGMRGVIEEPIRAQAPGDAPALTTALAARMGAIFAAQRAQIHVRGRLRIFEGAAGPEPLGGSPR